MKSQLADVQAFHEKFNIPGHLRPTFDKAVIEFRKKFLREELTELEDAEDLPAVADALADIAYVALGGLYSLLGPECAQAVWDEVQRSNMDKVGPTPDMPSWKFAVKPADWRPPQIATVILAHLHRA